MASSPLLEIVQVLRTLLYIMACFFFKEPKEKLNIMHGIQSLHGWMSAQTKITPKIKKKSKIKEDSEEEVILSDTIIHAFKMH